MSNELEQLIDRLDDIEGDLLELVNGPLAHASFQGMKRVAGNLTVSTRVSTALAEITLVNDFFHGELRRNERAAMLAAQDREQELEKLDEPADLVEPPTPEMVIAHPRDSGE